MMYFVLLALLLIGPTWICLVNAHSERIALKELKQAREELNAGPKYKCSNCGLIGYENWFTAYHTIDGVKPLCTDCVENA